MVTISKASQTEYSETTGVKPNLSLGAPVEAVLIGLASWGPIAGETIDSVQQGYVDCPSWPYFREKFGNFETNHPAAKYAYVFFQTGGQMLHVARTNHFSDYTDGSTFTAARSSYTFQYTSASATYGTVGPSSNSETFFLAAGDALDFSVDGGGTDTATFDAASATLECATAENYNLSAGGETLTVKINQEATAQTVTFQTSMFATPAAATAEEVAAAMNAQLKRCQVYSSTSDTKVTIDSDRQGTGAYVQVTGGTANAVLGFSTSEVQGTGDVANIEAVTVTEAIALIEADVAGVTGIDHGDGTFSVRTDTSGSSGSIQVEATSTADTKFGLDNTSHAGTDTTAVDALKVEGRYCGTRGDNFEIEIAAATSGVAAEFDLIVRENSVFAKRFHNQTYATVEDNINPEGKTELIKVTKMADYRPDNATQSLTGGSDGLTSLDDNDYNGDQEAGTGVYAFDDLDNFRVALTDRETAPHVKAFETYIGVTRQAMGIVLYDIPTGYTYAQARTHMTGQGLKDYTNGEFGAVFWPYANWPNPDRNIFGTTADEVAFPSSAAVAGRCAWVSGQRDAGFADEPGNRGPGTFTNATSVVDKNVNKLWCRNLLYPDLINPVRGKKGSVYNDGVLMNKVDGNFPTIAQRITACEVAQRILDLLDRMRHRGLSESGLRERRRKIESILKVLTKANAFASDKDSLAWEVDDSGNTPEKIRNLTYTVKVSIATINPGEFNEFELGYNEQGLLYADLSA